MPQLATGTRVRAKTRTMGQWKGTGTVVAMIGSTVTVLKDGLDETAEFMPHELAVMRDQTPLDTSGPP